LTENNVAPTPAASAAQVANVAPAASIRGGANKSGTPTNAPTGFTSNASKTKTERKRFTGSP
jgi:hypothetical protein